jgi:hypothetical protein
VGYWVTHNSARSYSPGFAAASLTDGAVGALLVRYAATDPGTPRLRQVLGFFAASAIGAAAGAILGAWSAWRELTATPYRHLWQLWWAGNWLGTLTLAPVGLAWAVRFLAPERAAHPVHPMKPAGSAAGCCCARDGCFAPETTCRWCTFPTRCSSCCWWRPTGCRLDG